MTNLETSSIRPARATPKWVAVSFLVLSIIGFLDASYLTMKHYLGTPITCSIFNGCDKVTTSPYSMIVGIPVALIGVAYYFIIFLLMVLYFDTGKEPWVRTAVYLTPFGFLASLGFVYIQAFILHAFCLYCLLSALTSTLLFVIGLLLYQKVAR